MDLRKCVILYLAAEILEAASIVDSSLVNVGRGGITPRLWIPEGVTWDLGGVPNGDLNWSEAGDAGCV